MECQEPDSPSRAFEEHMLCLLSLSACSDRKPHAQVDRILLERVKLIEIFGVERNEGAQLPADHCCNTTVESMGGGGGGGVQCLQAQYSGVQCIKLKISPLQWN